MKYEPFIAGGIIGLLAGYHIGIWRAFARLGSAEMKARMRTIGWLWYRNR